MTYSLPVIQVFKYLQFVKCRVRPRVPIINFYLEIMFWLQKLDFTLSHF